MKSNVDPDPSRLLKGQSNTNHEHDDHTASPRFQNSSRKSILSPSKDHVYLLSLSKLPKSADRHRRMAWYAYPSPKCRTFTLGRQVTFIIGRAGSVRKVTSSNKAYSNALSPLSP